MARRSPQRPPTTTTPPPPSSSSPSAFLLDDAVPPRTAVAFLPRHLPLFVLSLFAVLIGPTTAFVVVPPLRRAPSSTPFVLPRDATTMSLSSSSAVPSASSSSSLPSEGRPPPTEEELNSILKVAIEASKKAGEIIVGQSGAEVTERKASARDLLTEIDPLCEKTIRDTVLSSYPDHDFLGEEDVPPGAEASAAAIDALLSNPDKSDYLWIVDPIDGTTNFVHGMPLCMPSIAVAYKGEVVVGMIHDPHRDETFSAIKNGGAFLNGEPIKVGSENVLSDAVIAMGSPPAIESMQMSLKGVEALMPKCRTIRMLGSAALMLAWVACGRLTCYWEYDLSSWDVSAGVLLVREAGGRFTDLNGTDWELRTRKICASNDGGSVHDEILEALRDAGVV